MTSLSSTIGPIKVQNCIYNASGPRTGLQGALEAIGKSSAGAVLSKSATLKAQTGNEFPRYKEYDMGNLCPMSINSEGLPNKGIDYYIDPKLVKAIKDTGKPYIVSLSGLSLEDNLEMLSRVMNTDGVDGVELNLACPNIPNKPVIAYDFEQMEAVLSAVTALDGFKNKPLGVKLAPYFDLPHFKRVAEILNKFPIAFVVCTNTMGNGLVVDVATEMPAIAPKGGHGGLGGGVIKCVALANVRQFRQLLRPDIDIIGVGGVAHGRDVFEFLLCGASAVQVGTKHFKEGPICFDRISQELTDLMKNKGYTCVADFQNKLKPYSKEAVDASKAQGDEEAEHTNSQKLLTAKDLELNTASGKTLFVVIGIMVLGMMYLGFHFDPSSPNTLAATYFR